MDYTLLNKFLDEIDRLRTLSDDYANTIKDSSDEIIRLALENDRLKADIDWIHEGLERLRNEPFEYDLDVTDALEGIE